MIPLIPVLVLSFLSFASSAFVILRIIIPILPPHPLSRRVSPAEFGLPTFRSLSPADKSHIWLASLDIFALAIFVWQAVAEATGGPTGVAIADDPVSSIRLWFTVTVRQGCLLMITVITLLHVRMGRSVSFGKKHWMLWAPTALLSMTSTALAGVLSAAGISSLFVGIAVYSATIVILSTAALGCLIGTLVIIKRNLAAMNEEADPWPPVRQVEEKGRPSFCTEEIDAIRDGASWITSTAGGSSRRNSVSAWSFSTHHTVVTASQHGHPGGRPQNGSHPSVPAKSSYWFNSTTPHDIDIPPVPPLPSPYGPISPTAEDLNDPDPFRRDMPSPLPNHPRGRLDSQTSWLTSSNGSQTTLSAWSYPTTVYEGSIRNVSSPDFQTALTAVSRPLTPAMANAQVLGGYGYAPGNTEAEKGLASLAAPPGTNLNISVYPAIGWFLTIWVPLGLSLPYLISLCQQTTPSTALYILFVLSVTLSSPLLAVNVICGSHLPIPTGLFDVRGEKPKVSSAPSELPSNKWSHEYKRSMSTTITAVEGRRSGDVWLTNGDAVDGKNKLGRAVGMLSPMPKLSVMPPEECDEPLTPPLPIQDADSSLPLTIHNTPETSAQFGRLRMDSKASSHHLSGGDESMAYASRIMVAQRHYSALAQTVVVPGSSPDKQQATGTELFVSNATGALVNKPATHLRSRSITSISGPQTVSADSFNISPPPSFPLPPTPPNVRAARLAQLAHKKSFSSGFSFGPVDDMNEIDALTAGVLPLLVPGLKVGHEMRIKEDDWSPPGTFSKNKGKNAAKKLTEFGEDFSSPEIHSTPARRRPREPRGRKESGHKRNHFSLPSLSLGKDGIHSLATWSAEIRGALENKVGQYTSVPSNVDLGRRNTVFGAESVPTAQPLLKAVQEEEDEPILNPGAGLGRVMSTRSLGLRADVPRNVNTARSSVISNTAAPTSAASTVTLFEDFEAGMISGPQAESTPHNTVSHKTTHRQNNVPPVPVNRHSSIVYIKSENHSTTTNPPMTESSSSSSAMSSFAQWSSRAVRPLMTKNSLKLQRKISTADSSSPSPPREGLRPLSLLQDRDPNTAQGTSPLSVGGTRPLTLGKKQKSRMAVPQDENAGPDSIRSGHRKNLKSLKLARSETAKMRGILRKGEILPDVVVRPPSTTEAFAYSFDD